VRFNFVTSVFKKFQALRDKTPFRLVVNDVSEDLFAFIFRFQEFG